MANKSLLPLSFYLSLRLFLKASPSSLVFLHFSSLLMLSMLFFEILLDFSLDFDLIIPNLALRLVLYCFMLFPNSLFLIIFSINPSSIPHLLTKYFFCLVLSGFLIAGLFIRLFLFSELFDLLPFCISTIPISTILIFLTSKPKFRLSLVFLHQIALILLLNFKWSLTLSSNLKLLMNFFISLAIFWKSSNFILQSRNSKNFNESSIKK